MNRIRTIMNHKVALTALVLVLGASIYLATLPQTDAVVVVGPGVWVYYSNASYTTVVGARGNGCCGTVISWGITTSYKKFERIYCTTGQCNI